MAYFGKLGVFLRGTVARSVLQQQNGVMSIPANYVSCRGMASAKLFIGGLEWRVSESAVKECFETFGEVTEVKIIFDRETGRSRGFGFVSFTNEQDAETALQALNGRQLSGRTIRVNYATEKSPQDRMGGGMYRGGFGGGGEESSGESASGGFRDI